MTISRTARSASIAVCSLTLLAFSGLGVGSSAVADDGTASAGLMVGTASEPLASAVKIAADTTDEGAFGIAVDLTADGSTAIVGAQQHNGDRGGAYVFQDEDGTWTKSADLTRPGLAYGDSYGNAVAISSDGTWAMVGEVGWDQLTGRVFVLHETSGSWHVVDVLKAPQPVTYTHFGDSISMDAAGNEAVIGELGADGFIGRAYVFTLESDGTWHRTQQLTPHTTGETDFGTSVALSADGSTALIGANSYDSGLGAAYLFHATAGAWSRAGRLTGKPHIAGANFGNAVALNADGTTAVVGAVYEGAGGAAYVYSQSGKGWHQRAHLTVSGTSEYGSAIGIDASGTTAVVGAEATQVSGVGYVYSDATGSWTQTGTLTPTVSDEALFGIAVSVDAAGDEGLVGAAFDDNGNPDQSGFGAVYLEPLS